MVRPAPVPFQKLLAVQAGTFSLSQAYAGHVTEAYLHAQLKAQRWQRRGPRVFTAFTGPLHHDHQAWLAVLSAGVDACLSHESAAHRHGIVARPTEVHVVISHFRRIEPITGVRVHRTRKPRAIGGAPPTSSVEDAICDLAVAGWSPRRLAGPVTSALQRGLTTPARIHETFTFRGRFRGVVALRELVDDAATGAASALELRFLRDVERAHGLPPGVRQAVVVRSDGSVTRPDVHYPDFKVVVELDGRSFHGSFEARLRDSRRDRLAARDDELPLRYGWLDVTQDACLAAAELAETFRSRGWAGRAERCPHCG